MDNRRKGGAAIALTDYMFFGFFETGDHFQLITLLNKTIIGVMGSTWSIQNISAKKKKCPELFED